MVKRQGCWAASLNDCSGPLSEEHYFSVGVWGTLDPDANRKDKLKIKVQVGGPFPRGGPGVKTVRKLAGRILCRGHNNGSSEIDEEGKRLAEAIGFFRMMNLFHGTPIALPTREYLIDGPKIERYFLKTAINNSIGMNLPIGGPDAAPGRPDDELVEMVFGRRAVQAPIGLYGAGIANDHHFPKDDFAACPETSSGYVSGVVIEFRGFDFVVSLENASPPPQIPYIGRTINLTRPVGKYVNRSGSIQIRFDWP
jgi:hypothetical protein